MTYSHGNRIYDIPFSINFLKKNKYFVQIRGSLGFGVFFAFVWHDHYQM